MTRKTILSLLFVFALMLTPIFSYSGVSPVDLLPTDANLVGGVNFKQFANLVEKNSSFSMIKNAKEYKQYKDTLNGAGINPETDIKRIYLGGFTDKNNEIEGLAIITGSFNEDKIASAIKSNNKNMKTQNLTKTIKIYNVIDKKDTWMFIYKNKIVFVGNKKWVVDGIKKLGKGKSASFKQKKLNSASKAAKNSMWTMVALDKHTKSSIMNIIPDRQLKVFLAAMQFVDLRFNVKGTNVILYLEIECDKKQTAESIKSILDVQIDKVKKDAIKKGNKTLSDLLENTNLKTSGASIKLNIKTDLNTLAKIKKEVL